MKNKLFNLPLNYVSDFTHLFRIIVGYLFIFASLDKISDPSQFSFAISNYHITPYFVDNIAALIIPWLEFFLGLNLILGVYMNGTTKLLSILLLFFIIILFQANVRGINIDCGCFSSIVKSNSEHNFSMEQISRIVEDIILLFMVIYIRFEYRKK